MKKIGEVLLTILLSLLIVYIVLSIAVRLVI